MKIEKMYYDILNKIKNSIDNVTKCTFLCTFIVGIIAHIYVFTNKFFNYFELNNIFSRFELLKGDALPMGRWFLPVVTNMFTHYSIPSVNGFVTLCYMSVAAVLIVKALNIRSKTVGCFFGAVWITFPGLASIFSYGVNSDAFCFSILLAVIAGYLVYHVKYGVIFGGIVLCFALGIYQPYLSIAVSVVFLFLFSQVLHNSLNLKSFIRLFLRGLAMLSLGFILYYIVLQVVLMVVGTSLSGYHGVNDMTSFTAKGLAKGFVYSYLYFIRYFFTTEYMYTWGRVIANIIASVIFIAIIVKKYYWKHKHNGIQKILVALFIILIPLGLNSTPFLMGDRVGAGVDRYMLVSIMFLWLMFLMVIDQCKQKSLLNSIAYLCVTVAIVSGYLVCNQAYYRMEGMTVATNSLCNRIIARIEVMPEWDRETPVFLANCNELINKNLKVDVKEFQNLTNMTGTGIQPFYNDVALTKYMNVFMQFPMKTPTEKEKDNILISQVFEKMPCYPEEGSIMVIDEVIVVKFQESE